MPMVTSSMQEDVPLLLFNKERDVEFRLKAESGLAKKLTEIIVNNESKTEGYFYCVTKKGKYYVNPTLLPDQKW